MKMLLVFLSLIVVGQSFASSAPGSNPPRPRTYGHQPVEIPVMRKVPLNEPSDSVLVPGDRIKCPLFKGKSDFQVKAFTLNEVLIGKSMCGLDFVFYGIGATVAASFESTPLLSILVADPFESELHHQGWEKVSTNWLGTLLGTIVNDGIVGPIKASKSLIKTGKLPKDFVFLKSTKNMYRHTRAHDGPKNFYACHHAKVAITCANKELARRAESRIRRKVSVNNGSRNSFKEVSQPQSLKRSPIVKAQ